MNIQARLEQLRAWSMSKEKEAAQLALKDLDWWLSEIEWASKKGKSYCLDSTRSPFYSNSRRANQHYHRALSALLGEGFKVGGGTGLYIDTNWEEYFYRCVQVAW